jgi:WD40 repeat protein/serine/threonine protein kinase
MSPDPAPEELPLSQDESAAEKLILGFREACRANPLVDIPPLPEGPNHLSVIVGMAKIAIHVAWNRIPRPEAKEDRRADRAWVEYYLERYPELRLNESLVKELISVERSCRPEADTSCDHYHDRFPEYQAVVEDLFDPRTGELRTNAPPGYKNLKELGRGGMGIVYKAEQVKPERVVALKMMLKGALAKKEELDRFQTEAEAVARLEHAHIVPLYEVGEHAGQQYFTMRYVEGAPLAAHPRKTSRDEALLLRWVAEAVSFAHQRGILHRDLKPGNILVDLQGEPHVVDFGLAKSMPSPGGESKSGATPTSESTDVASPGLESRARLTRTGTILGTPKYTAPEQAAGKKDLTVGVDVYSLGVILYERLTGRTPFSGENDLEVPRREQEDEPTWTSAVLPRLDRDLEAICLKCMKNDPAKRYHSAQALAEDLGRWLDGLPIQARQSGWAERLWKRCRRKPLVASLAAGFVAVMVTAVFFGFRWNEASNAAALRDAMLKGETKLRIANQYHSLVNKVAEKVAESVATPHHTIDWTRQCLEELKEAANLQTDLRDRVRLRSLAARCLATIDLREDPPVFVSDFNASCLAFSPDGTRLAVGQRKMQFGLPSVLLIDLRKEHVVRTLGYSEMVFNINAIWDIKKSGVRALGFSMDGKWLVAGTRSGGLCSWDMAQDSAKPISRMAHQEGVTGLAFSPNGKILVSCSSDKTLKIWDTALWNEIASYDCGGDCTGVAYSPDGTLLACGTSNWLRLFDGAVLLAPKPQFVIRKEIPGHHSNICFHPGGRLLAASPGGEITLFDIKEARPDPYAILREGDFEDAHRDTIDHMEFSPDGSLLVSGSADRQVKLWEAATGRLLATLTVRGSGIVYPTFSRDGRHLAITGDDQTLLYKLTGLGEQTTVAHHGRPVQAMALSPDGQALACATADDLHDVVQRRGEVTIWGTPDGRLLDEYRFEVNLHSAAGLPCSLAYHPQEAVLTYTGESTKEFHVWDVVRQRRLTCVMDKPVRSLNFAPNGKTLWSVAGDSVIVRSWPDQTVASRWYDAVADVVRGRANINSLAVGNRWALAGSEDGFTKLLYAGEKTSFANQWAGRGGPVESVALSADESVGAMGTQKGLVKVVGVPDGVSVLEVPGHMDSVTALAFTRDGHYLASGSRDHTVVLWVSEAKTFHEVVRLQFSRPVVSICFSPSGKQLAVLIQRERAVRIWHLDRLREQLRQMDLDW